jgi:hypothetical protein
VLTTAAGVARFYSDLYSGKLLSATSLRQMTTFHQLSVGVVPPAGTYYGLGQMYYPAWTLGITSNVSLIGHPGEDWGSGFQGAHWVPELNLSLAVGFNMGESPSGMNTSLTWQQNALFFPAALCRILDALSQFRGRGGIDCRNLMPV